MTDLLSVHKSYTGARLREGELERRRRAGVNKTINKKGECERRVDRQKK